MPVHSSNFNHSTAFCTECSFASLDVLEHSPRLVTALKICSGRKKQPEQAPKVCRAAQKLRDMSAGGQTARRQGARRNRKPAARIAARARLPRRARWPSGGPGGGVARPGHPPAPWRPLFPSLPVAAGRLRASLHPPWAGVVPAVFPSPGSLDSSPRRDSPGGPRRAHPPCSPRPSRVPPASPGAPLRPSPSPSLQPRSALPAPGSHDLHAPRAAKVWIRESPHS